MQNFSVKEARQESAIGVAATVSGWIRTRRDSKGGFSFLEVNDGSCLGNLQVVAPAELTNYESEVRHLTAGCSVRVVGQIVASGGAGQATELRAEAITIYGGADPETYPLQKKRHTLEKLREWAHLRPRTNAIGAVMRVRNRVCRSIHDFFQEDGFLYIQTPIITASDCEGAGEMFRVTTLDADKPARTPAGEVDFAQDFFGKRTHLTVSGQLEGEVYASALGKIYTFGPTFRAENSHTSRHLAEFWMVEPEAAFYELPDNIDLAQAFLKRIVGDVLRDCQEDLALFTERIDADLMPRLEKLVADDFVRLPYTEAITRLTDSGESFEYPVTWGSDLQAEHERFLTEKQFGAPVVLYDYPASIKPFYMYVNEPDTAGRLTVRAMDVLVPGVGEIIGGSQREHRLEVLERRMAEQSLDPAEYWWYTDLRRYGSVPHSGFGLGLERMVQYVTGMANIRDVIPFPRTPLSAEF
ncbi:asparagine--tRNA ligase [Botrimarina hoheduenensis]|uniref:Asparagine--tRNA ligase n=1 Tax=Botrimarina hoheduenensis TaxID=2528000 RepID=A0A5C5WA08_9BACT|nr:asparagine--tRNA ligase [Botrimarina hoheduenensis]TWT47327.1 Asparagine--tRNA ligase [Botrimarina hoheduenensis]